MYRERSEKRANITDSSDDDEQNENSIRKTVFNLEFFDFLFNFLNFLFEYFSF